MKTNADTAMASSESGVEIRADFANLFCNFAEDGDKSEIKKKLRNFFTAVL
jgi:hypothetical protein